MKLKSLALIASAIALSLTTAPLSVKAETTTASSLMIAQLEEGSPRRGPLKDLNLTQQQQAQLQEIRRNARAEMEKVLTPQQQEQFRAAKKNRQGWRQVMASLTEEQRTQLQQIRQSTKAQIEGILTPEQKQQLEQMRTEKRARRQQRNRNVSP